MSKEKKYTFRSADFYGLLEKQQYKCAYTGRELTPQTTHAVHIVPLKKGGEHNLENIVLVDSAIYEIKKQLGPDDLLQVAKEIIRNAKASKAN